MNSLHERKYHPFYKPWMKKPKGWSGDERCHEEPAEHSAAKSDPPTELGMFDRHSHSLQQEVAGRKAVTCASGQRDDQVVYQARDKEHQETGRASAQSSPAMPVFAYRGLAANGRSVAGVVDADSVRTARGKLRERGIFPTDLAEEESHWPPG